MAAASRRFAPSMNSELPTTPSDLAPDPQSAAGQLFAEPFAFDFFQAIRVLERAFPDRVPVGRSGPLAREVVRLHAHLSLSFPPSSIYALAPSTAPGQPPGLIF